MANLPFMQLPAVEAPRSALLDFAPLAQAFRDYNKGAQLAARGEQDRAIGQTAASQGYGAAGKQALNMGRLDEGVKFADAGQGQRDALTKRYGVLAQQIDTVQDPQQRARMWAGTLERMKRHAQAMGVQGEFDPDELDPVQGPKLFMAQAGIFDDPLDREYKRAQIGKLNKDAANGAETPSNVREWQHFNNLSPEDQQRYLTMKRAEKYLDLGDRYGQPNPVAPDQMVREVPKNVAEEARQKKVGNEMGERQMAQPKAASSLAAIDAKADIVLKTIGEARQMVGPYTAGFGGAALSSIPGTAARDLSAKLDTLKANAGFAELQTMRDNSPTGGALGQVAVQELAMLQATVTSLEQAQTPQQLSQALDAYETFIRESKVRRQQAYETTYGGAQPAAGDGWTNVGGVRIREKR